MSNPHQPTPALDSLDELAASLIEVGAVLSQMISHMAEYSASGRAAPNAPSIPEVMHTLVRSALEDTRKGHSKRDIRLATRIVETATDLICENILLVSPGPDDALADFEPDDEDWDPSL